MQPVQLVVEPHSHGTMYQYQGRDIIVLWSQYRDRFSDAGLAVASPVEAEALCKTQGTTDSYLSLGWIVSANIPIGKPPNPRLVAFSVCIASVIRAPYIAQVTKEDPAWSFAFAGIWSTVELTIGNVCACLPTIRPVVVHIFQRKSLEVTHGVGYRGDLEARRRLCSETDSSAYTLKPRRESTDIKLSVDIKKAHLVQVLVQEV